MLNALLEFLRTLTTPERLIQLLTTVFTGWLGYGLLFGIVFAETGLLTGFFLPGDSFLFTVGVVAGAAQLKIYVVVPLLMAAGIARRQHRVFLRAPHWPAHFQPAEFAPVPA